PDQRKEIFGSQYRQALFLCAGDLTPRGTPQDQRIGYEGECGDRLIAGLVELGDMGKDSGQHVPYRDPSGGGIPSCLQIARASGYAISRWRGTEVERSASI